ncbi:MAG: 2-oxoacid:ferredoxin oxidoreductase subunit beta, partial [Ignavibacteriaceae bacterium]|nr:2-oxoacid:ferredoxin oxidoreductase subunit beta [Ignavibacteriaceae bacterium]
QDKGIKLDGPHPVVVDISNGKYSKDDLWIHDEFADTPIHAMILAHMDERQGFPSPIGVFRQYSKATYDNAIRSQIDNVIGKKGKGDLEKVLFSANTWEVS